MQTWFRHVVLSLIAVVCFGGGAVSAKADESAGREAVTVNDGAVSEQPERGEVKMYGMIGKMTAVAGQRDALIAILLKGVSGMPGCLSYVVAKDPADTNAIWITEVWDSQTSHQASLSLPSVKDAITRGKPLIAGFGEMVVTEPVGGHGLPATKPALSE